MSNRKKGREVRIFLNLDGNGLPKTGTTILYATSCDVSINANTEKVVDKDAPKAGITLVNGTDWTMSTSNILADDMSNLTELLKAMQNDKEVLIGFHVVANPNDKGLDGATAWKPGVGVYGRAKVTSVQSNAPAEGNATLSATFTGSGDLSVSTSTGEPA